MSLLSHLLRLFLFFFTNKPTYEDYFPFPVFIYYLLFLKIVPQNPLFFFVRVALFWAQMKFGPRFIFPQKMTFCLRQSCVKVSSCPQTACEGLALKRILASSSRSLSNTTRNFFFRLNFSCRFFLYLFPLQFYSFFPSFEFSLFASSSRSGLRSNLHLQFQKKKKVTV